MSDYKSIKTEELTKIANAIRYKTGKSDKISLEAMAKKIREIEGGVSLPELENEGSAADLLSGKQLIDSEGNIVEGTIATKTASNLTASGATVTVPAGYYAIQATKSVTTATQATPSVSINSSGLITATATQTAGYVSAGTKSGTKQLTTQAAKTITPSTSSQTAVASGVYTTGAVTVAAIPSTYVKPTATKGATTYTPTTSNQTIAAGTYCSGVQTIKGDANLKAENIAEGVSIFGVTGTHSGGGSGGGGEVAPPTTPTDGKTRVYIHLEYGRTSPMLGICPKGTVTVDWGDGTKPDILTGTSTTTVKWTPTHEYTAPGDYVIALTVEGTMGFYGNYISNQHSGILRYASGEDSRNQAYQNAVQKVEIGESVTSIGSYAFSYCYSLASITIPESVTSIGGYAFQNCYSLASITIPESVTSIGDSAFYSCYSLASITIPEGVTSIGGYAFQNCYSLASITIPEGVTSIGSYAFSYCYSLASITIPEGVTSIRSNAFQNCYSLASITIPESVTSIGDSAFYSCYGMRYYDFTACTSVPALSSMRAFSGIPSDCQMLIPAALYDEWRAATNWTYYAKYMVAV